MEDCEPPLIAIQGDRVEGLNYKGKPTGEFGTRVALGYGDHEGYAKVRWDDWPDDTHKGIFMWGKVGVTPIDGYRRTEGGKV